MYSLFLTSSLPDRIHWHFSARLKWPCPSRTWAVEDLTGEVAAAGLRSPGKAEDIFFQEIKNARGNGNIGRLIALIARIWLWASHLEPSMNPPEMASRWFHVWLMTASHFTPKSTIHNCSNRCPPKPTFQLHETCNRFFIICADQMNSQVENVR